MQLIGQPIKHVTFGKGVVTDWNGKVITVCFSAGEKKFIYPDTFSNFLILKNADAQKKVQHLLDVREEERETELKELLEQQEKKHMLENLKLSPQSQAVFHIDAEAHEAVSPHGRSPRAAISAAIPRASPGSRSACSPTPCAC